jgi:collagenase-like PrtC family protease
LKSTVVLHIVQPVKIVVAEPDRVIVAEQALIATIKNRTNHLPHNLSNLAALVAVFSLKN